MHSTCVTLPITERWFTQNGEIGYDDERRQSAFKIKVISYQPYKNILYTEMKVLYFNPKNQHDIQKSMFIEHIN